MTVVVDASVAFKWFFRGEINAAEALAIAEAGEPIIAPDLVIAEVCNAAWRSARLGRIATTDLADIALVLPRFLADLIPLVTLVQGAVRIAAELDHPVYDCFYLAAAEQRRLPLITADKRLIEKVESNRWRAAPVLDLAGHSRE